MTSSSCCSCFGRSRRSSRCVLLSRDSCAPGWVLPSRNCCPDGTVALHCQGATHLFERYVQPVLAQYDLQAGEPRRSPLAADVMPTLDKASAFLKTLEADKRS